MIGAISALARSSVAPGSQPHEAFEEVVDVVLVERLVEPEVAAVRRIEVARRHAGDRRRDFREPDGLADDPRIALVEVLPDAIRDHDDRGRRGGPGAACCGGCGCGGGGGGGTKCWGVKPPSVIGRPNRSKKPSVTP